MRKYKEYLNKSDEENLAEDWERMKEDLWKVFKDMKPKINTLDISNVVSKDLDKSKPVLQFQDSDRVIENICNVEDINDGLNKIKKILQDSDYTSYYTRVLDYPDYFWIDYSSHTTFFRVTKIGNESLGDIDGSI